MNVFNLCVRCSFLLCLGLTVPLAKADGGYKRCAPGDRVQYRDGRVGTVTAIGRGGDATTCMVQFDGENDSGMYDVSGLHLAGTSAVDPDTASIKVGRYACYGGVPPQYMDYVILIQSDTSYADLRGNPGRYSYDPTTQILTFESGTFAGEYGMYRHAGEISLSLEPITAQTYFNTVCDLPR